MPAIKQHLAKNRAHYIHIIMLNCRAYVSGISTDSNSWCIFSAWSFRLKMKETNFCSRWNSNFLNFFFLINVWKHPDWNSKIRGENVNWSTSNTCDLVRNFFPSESVLQLITLLRMNGGFLLKVQRMLIPSWRAGHMTSFSCNQTESQSVSQPDIL